MTLTEMRKCKRCKEVIEMPSKSILCKDVGTLKYKYLHKCGILFQYGDAVKCRYGTTKIIGYKEVKRRKQND